jgi:hypothetical protein
VQSTNAFLKQIIWVALAIVILFVGLRVASFLMFPIGGGEYHAIFAYTPDGRVRVALITFATYLASLIAITVLLVWRRYPIPWWMIGAAASVVGLWAWWGIVSWGRQSPSFHATVLPLALAFPLVLLSVSWGMARLSRVSQRAA